MSSENILDIYGSEKIYRLACEKLTQVADIKEQCGKADVQYDANSNRITIEYLNRPYLFTLPKCEISLRDSEEQIPARDKILIVHYLTSAKGTPLTGKLITYRQVPGGAPYFTRFSKLVAQPLLSHFGEKPELLIPAAEKLGGKKVDRNDAAVTINAFSRVPITIALQRGDEEFAPTVSLLFDSTIPDYLHTQDIRILCEIIAWELIKFG